jgi:hypothetical protein
VKGRTVGEIIKQMTKDFQHPGAHSEEEDLADVPEIIVPLSEEQALAKKASWRRIQGTSYFLAYSAFIAAVFLGAHDYVDYSFRHFTNYFPYLVSLPTLLMLFWAVRNGFHLFREDQIRWPRYIAEAQVQNTDIMLNAISELFRTYVGTRKIGMYAYLWTVWGLYVAALYLFQGLNTKLNGIIVSSVSSLFVLTCVNLYFGVRLSNSFRIGQILVDHVALINERATQSYMTVARAQRNISALGAVYKVIDA